MSKKQKTYHLMILDKSGSMGSVRDVTISGLNEQLGSIKKAEEDFLDQEQIVCFVTFNNNVDTDQIWNSKITDIEDFNQTSYAPGGMTALYDAVGMGIDKLKDQIKDELASRSANVVVTIFTDGSENVSREYSGSQVKELIEEIQEAGQWTVAFVGCGDDVFNVAEAMGISRGNTMAYDAGVEGTTRAFTSMSQARYGRAQSYSQANTKGISTANVNNEVDFFENIDLEDNPPTMQTDGPDSAIDITDN
jgi:uncharacterized protein YegL